MYMYCNFYVHLYQQCPRTALSPTAGSGCEAVKVWRVEGEDVALALSLSSSEEEDEPEEEEEDWREQGERDTPTREKRDGILMHTAYVTLRFTHTCVHV